MSDASATPGRWIRRLPLVVLLSLGCASTETSSGPAPAADVFVFVPDASAPAPEVAGEDAPTGFGAESLPRVELPADLSGLKPPLAVVGSDTGEAGLVYAAALSGYFLLRVQQADGSFKYEYLPISDTWCWQDVIHRQVGPAYALVLLYGATKRDEFRLAADWAFEYAKPRIADQGDGELRITDMGATSILIFGLAHYGAFATANGAPDASKWHDTLVGLGKHLLARQNEDGSFKEGSPLGRGQAVQALSHLDRYVPGGAYRDALLRAAGYSCDHKDEIATGDVPYFLLYAGEALRHLNAVTGDARWNECSVALTDVNIANQYTSEDKVDPSWHGGFGKTDGSTPTWSASLRLESMADALGLARDRGDTARAELLEDRLRVGAEFVMRQQWRVGETTGYPNPEEILGCYPYFLPNDNPADLTCESTKLSWPKSRTDLAWHGTAMLVKTARVLGEEVVAPVP